MEKNYSTFRAVRLRWRRWWWWWTRWWRPRYHTCTVICTTYLYIILYFIMGFWRSSFSWENEIRLERSLSSFELSRGARRRTRWTLQSRWNRRDLCRTWRIFLICSRQSYRCEDPWEAVWFRFDPNRPRDPRRIGWNPLSIVFGKAPRSLRVRSKQTERKGP